KLSFILILIIILQYSLKKEKQKPKILRSLVQQLNSVKVKPSGFSEKVFAYKNLLKNFFLKTLTECLAHFQKAFFFSFFSVFSSFSFGNISTEKFHSQREGLNSWFEL
ncbi:hypothetical protein M2T82_18500, partial [Elizabethkingia ursingii]|uniref:hypothetical protein n=1 Tax=Elizabethkingia ursingii TaxID=1756150 RepID=UPI002011E888